MAKDFHINPKRTYPWEPVGVRLIPRKKTIIILRKLLSRGTNPTLGGIMAGYSENSFDFGQHNVTKEIVIIPKIIIKPFFGI